MIFINSRLEKNIIKSYPIDDKNKENIYQTLPIFYSILLSI